MVAPVGTVQVYEYVPGSEGVAVTIAEVLEQTVGLFTVTPKIGLTIIVNVVLTAHCNGFGVNVYVVVARLFNAGDQDPTTPLIEVVGNAANVAPLHIGVIALNTGVKLGGETTTVIVALLEQKVAAGVKV